MIPRFSPNYKWEELLQAFKPASHKAVERLEQLFAQRARYPYAIAFKYGRSGLYYLLKVLNKPGHKVIMPAYTCVVVSNAVVQAGYQPVFLDCAPGRFQPDPQDYLDQIDAETAMIIPTHLFGLSEDVKALYQTVKELYPHVFVLEDCAHGFFCEDGSGYR